MTAIGFNQEGYEQYKKIAREVMRRMMNTRPDRGRWQQREGGTGGGNWIGFTITDVFCPGDDDYDDAEGQGRWYVHATVNTYSGGCGKIPPGYDEYTQTVRIFDKCILQYYTVDQLLGIGTADGLPMDGDAVYYYPFDSAECAGYWEVKSICGEPTCGGSESPP